MAADNLFPDADKSKAAQTTQAAAPAKTEAPKADTKPVETKPAEKPTTEQAKPVTKDPLDHDNDGKKGGTAPAATTQAKPEGETKVDTESVQSAPTPAADGPALTNQNPPQVADQNPAGTSLGSEPTPKAAADSTEPQVEDEEDDEPETEVKPDELTFLKRRADLMGISYPNNIQIDALRNKIAAKLAVNETEPEPVPEDDGLEDDETPTETRIISEDNVTGEDPEATARLPGGRELPPKTKKLSVRQFVIQNKMKLVRLRITNMDPKKSDLPGEFITVANEYIGTVRKFVPFGEATDDGFHVPYCIFEVLRDRKFLNIRTKKGAFGTPVVQEQWAKEFALEVLPPLTQDELNRLATAQIAAGSVE